MAETSALEPYDSRSIQPIPRRERTVIKPLPIDDVVEAFEAFQVIKRRLIKAEDIQRIGNGEFVKKSGWRKVAMAFGLDDEIVSQDFDYDEKGNITFASFQVKAIAPNGRYATGWGSCALSERNFSKPNHDIPATAHTRAKNRAISDLVGGGEVSAEEMSQADSAPQKANANAPSKAQLDRFDELMDWAVNNGEIDKAQGDEGKAWARKVSGSKVGAEIDRWKKRKAEAEVAMAELADETGETSVNPDMGPLDELLDWADNKGIDVSFSSDDRDDPQMVANAVQYFEARQNWFKTITEKQQELAKLADDNAITDDQFLLLSDDLVDLKQSPDSLTIEELEHQFTELCAKIAGAQAEMLKGAEEGAEAKETASV